MRLRGLRRAGAFMVALGFRAAPGWMVGTSVSVVLRGVSSAATPLGLKILVDGITRHANDEVFSGIAVTAAAAVVFWLTSDLVASFSNILTQRTDLYLTLHVAELVNRIPGIEHFERPDYLRELDVLALRRRQLANAPNQVLSLVYVSIRTVLLVGLLASVNPIFLAIPLLAVLPSLTNSVGISIRQRADTAAAPDLRLANDLFALASTAAPAKELRLFGLAPELGSRHDDLVRTVTDGSDRAGLLSMTVEVAGWLAFASGFMGCLALVIDEAVHGHVSAGQLVMTVLIVQQVQRQIRDVTGSAGGLQQAKQAVDRALWLEDYAETETSRAYVGAVPDVLHTGITLDDVTFRYPGTESTVLRGVSFHMPAGATVAIIGENGAGKTTLAKLLSAMYRPSSGTIRLDGVDLIEIAPIEWRRRVAATFQDFANFELLARESVGVGDLARIDDDLTVRNALSRSGAEGLIDELDAGLDTLLGKSNLGGRELSVGQWQKLALGRGRMREFPLLLILDEPTASLDAQSEHALFEYYLRAAEEAGDRTGAITIIVSHRFSTVRMADLVVVLSEGTIAEIGDHASLMAADGLYAELFRLQERGYQ